MQPRILHTNILRQKNITDPTFARMVEPYITAVEVPMQSITLADRLFYPTEWDAIACQALNTIDSGETIEISYTDPAEGFNITPQSPIIITTSNSELSAGGTLDTVTITTRAGNQRTLIDTITLTVVYTSSTGRDERRAIDSITFTQRIGEIDTVHTIPLEFVSDSQSRITLSTGTVTQDIATNTVGSPTITLNFTNWHTTHEPSTPSANTNNTLPATQFRISKNSKTGVLYPENLSTPPGFFDMTQLTLRATPPSNINTFFTDFYMGRYLEIPGSFNPNLTPVGAGYSSYYCKTARSHAGQVLTKGFQINGTNTTITFSQIPTSWIEENWTTLIAALTTDKFYLDLGDGYHSQCWLDGAVPRPTLTSSHECEFSLSITTPLQT